MMPNPSSDQSTPFTIRDAARFVSSLTEARGALGVTANELFVLVHTLDKGRTSATELADLCRLNLASTGALIDRMVAAEWLTRTVDPTDRRRQLVFPTKKLVRASQELIGHT